MYRTAAVTTPDCNLDGSCKSKGPDALTRRPMMLAAATAIAVLAAAAAQHVPAELADGTMCASLGFASTVPYQRAVPLSSPYSNATASVFLPVYASLPLFGVVDPSVTIGAIYLHGLGGDANTYYCTGAVHGSRGRAGVVTIAPWFGNEQVTRAYWEPGTGSGESSWWDTSRWMQGGDNSPSPPRFTTSFDALDAIVAALRNATAFPNLRLVTFVGFSAGAQLLGRYAFATRAGAPGAPPPHVRFVVSDASSYLYLDATRGADACRPLRDTGPAWGCTDFSAPPPSQCATYDTYKYGLVGIDQASLYLRPLADPAVRAAAIAAFGAKDVLLMLGDDDVCNCNSPGYANGPACVHAALTCAPNAAGPRGCCDTFPDSVTANDLAVDCGAALQGSNRLQRGLLYAAHLRAVFGGAARNVTTLPGVAHNNSGLYASDAFQRSAFA